MIKYNISLKEEGTPPLFLSEKSECLLRKGPLQPAGPLAKQRRRRTIFVDMEQKLKKIGQAFRIEGDYLGYEQIKVGNVNQTYKVTYRQPDGSPKNYIV